MAYRTRQYGVGHDALWGAVQHRHVLIGSRAPAFGRIWARTVARSSSTNRLHSATREIKFKDAKMEKTHDPLLVETMRATDNSFKMRWPEV